MLYVINAEYGGFSIPPMKLQMLLVATDTHATMREMFAPMKS